MSDEQTTSELVKRLRAASSKYELPWGAHVFLMDAADRLEALQARVDALEGDNESFANDLHETMVAKDDLFDEALAHKRRVDVLEALLDRVVDAARGDDDIYEVAKAAYYARARKETKTC